MRFFVVGAILCGCVSISVPVFSQDVFQTMFASAQIALPERTLSHKVASGTRPSEVLEVSVAPVAPEFVAASSVIDCFFSSMRHGSATDLRQACSREVAIRTHLQDQKGNHIILNESISDLLGFVSQSGGRFFDIDVTYEVLPPDPGSLDFRAPYYLSINGKLSHCGVYTFELERIGSDWKIKQAMDTRARQCD
jgi:hypothetical protein